MVALQREQGQMEIERKPELGLHETKLICQTKQEKEIGTYFWIVLLK